MNEAYYKYVKKWRQKNPDHYHKLKHKNRRLYNQKYPERSRFSSIVCRLLKKKIIKRQPCCICGSIEHIQACTFSDNPMSPIWFCDSCHKQFHRKLRYSWIKNSSVFGVRF